MIVTIRGKILNIPKNTIVFVQKKTSDHSYRKQTSKEKTSVKLKKHFFQDENKQTKWNFKKNQNEKSKSKYWNQKNNSIQTKKYLETHRRIFHFLFNRKRFWYFVGLQSDSKWWENFEKLIWKNLFLDNLLTLKLHRRNDITHSVATIRLSRLVPNE